MRVSRIILNESTLVALNAYVTRAERKLRSTDSQNDAARAEALVATSVDTTRDAEEVSNRRNQLQLTVHQRCCCSLRLSRRESCIY